MKSLAEWHQLFEILTNITENIEPQVRYAGSLLVVPKFGSELRFEPEPS
jgi:hypothetical protein